MAVSDKHQYQQMGRLPQLRELLSGSTAVATWCVLLLGLAVIAFLAGGCEKTISPTGESDSSQDDQTAQNENQSLPGTIGAACYLDGMRLRQVQGYGLVVGLPGTGSKECPASLRKQLVKQITKAQYVVDRDDDQKIVEPTALLNSMSTAVVKVWGYVPAGASVGQRFDVFVEALPNTQTTSLEGGRLFTTELQIYDPAVGAGSRPLSRAWGAIFINPFDKPKLRGKLQLKRRGYILNGGKNIEVRKIRLVLYQRSYSLAKLIQQRINQRFTPRGSRDGKPIARAVSAGMVELCIPRQYQDQRAHFLALVRNVYRRGDPSYLDLKARELMGLIVKPQADGMAISLAWEGQGRTVVPIIRGLYASSNRQAAFSAARAGARLGDSLGAEVLGRFASDPHSPFRDQAAYWLGYSQGAMAPISLLELLADDNVQMRILAYEGLKRHNDSAIESYLIGDGSFILDVVAPSGQPGRLGGAGRPMVYVTRSGQATVAVFGKGLRLVPPLFYVHSDRSVTISAKVGDKQLTVVRGTPSGRSSQPINCSMELISFIKLLGSEPAADDSGQVTGLGLSYSHVVAILNRFCQNGALNAKFVLQEPLVILPKGPGDTSRPEKDTD